MELIPIRFGSLSKKRETKTFFVMRAFWLLTILISLSASPQPNDTRISLSVSNAPIEQVFKEIKKQSGFEFVYTREQMKRASPVTLRFQSASIREVLDACIEGQPFGYIIQGRFIALKDRTEKTKPTLPEGISGKVLDEKGLPISNANVTVKSSGQTTSTDASGTFFLRELKKGDYILISAVGYQLKQVPITGQTYMEIVLPLYVSEMDETLVIAYGTTTRRLSTGNVTKVSSRDIEQQPVSNVLAALEGRVPGMIVTQSSGVPGANYKVQIRGQNSIMQGSDPLYVIDGVPFLAGNSPINQLNTAAQLSPLNMLSPSDIESIEVLKDAEATALYGSRGANGVILITTKSAKNAKVLVTLNVYEGASRITRSAPMLTTSQYLQMKREAFQNDGIIPTAVTAPDLFLWDTTRNLDLKKLLTGNTSHMTNAQLSYSGGNAITRFSVAGSFNRQTTVFPGDLSDKIGTVHFSLSHTPASKKFFLRFTTGYGSDNNTLSSYDLSSFISMPPHIHLYDSEGKLNWVEGGSSFFSLGINNPLAYLNQKYLGQFDNLVSNMQFGFTVAKDLTIKTNLGYNVVLSDEIRTNPSTSIDPATGQLAFSTFAKRSQKNWIAEPQLEYKKNIGKLNAEVLAGTTWQQNGNELYFVTANNYTSDIQLESINAAGNVSTVNNSSTYRYSSVFGRMKLDVSDRYLISLSARRDGSSRFGPERQFGNFGAIGAAWIFSEESFIKKGLKFLSFGKLRASYGTAGNDNIGNYQFIDTWNNTTSTYQGVAGLIPSRLFNPDYSWELNKKMEAAADFGFLDDRILFSVAYFYNRCGNQLVPYSLPIQTGFNSVNENLDAVIENKGYEFTLRSHTGSINRLQWNSSINVTIHKNRLLQFPGLERSSYATQYVIGEPLSVKRLFKLSGVDPQTGNYQFEDIDKDGSFTIADRIIVKNTEPRFYGGFENSFSWKGFSLDIMLEFRKQTGVNYLSQLSAVPGYDYRNQPAFVLERWQNAGDKTSIQKFTQDVSSSAFTNAALYLSGSDGVYSDASFIRGKTISLSYDLPASVLKKMRVGKLRLYINAQNLFTITGYKGADPENQNLYVLPPLKTIAAGMLLNF